MDAWDFIRRGHCRKAVKAFTTKLRRDKSGPNYCGRGIAYLNLGQYDRALTDFHAANDSLAHTSIGYLESAGVAHWLSGREADAAAIWYDLVIAVERGKVQYTDGAGGVEPACLLWFAAIRLREEKLLESARRLIKKKVSMRNGRNWTISNWPGPIATFLLGRLDEAKLRDRIIEVPIARERQLCQAEFYIGVRALQDGQRPKARRAFRRAADLHAARIENEYYLATFEAHRRLRATNQKPLTTNAPT